MPTETYMKRYFDGVWADETATEWWLNFFQTLTPDYAEALQRGERPEFPVIVWAQVFLPHWMEIPFSRWHADMLQFIVDSWLGRLPEGKRRGVVVWPRSFGKSTCGRIAAMYIMTEAVRTGQYKPRQGQDYDMMYVTGTEDLAAQAVTPIWNEIFTNKPMIEQYGRLLDMKKGQSGLRLKRGIIREGLDAFLHNGFRIQALGRKGRMLGNHPAMLFCDDLEDAETISSEDNRAKFRAFWDETADPMMCPADAVPKPAVIIGNYTHISCWLRHIAYDPESELRLVSALMPDEEGVECSVWEQRYPTEKLLEMRELKPYEFATLFMNKPMIRGGSIVGPEDIKYYDPKQFEVAA